MPGVITGGRCRPVSDSSSERSLQFDYQLFVAVLFGVLAVTLTSAMAMFLYGVYHGV